MFGSGKEQVGSTQEHLPISEVKEGVVVLRDGSLRSVIMVSSINLALKSDAEKEAVVYSYQDFLNSLDFPVQISIISKKLDLTQYLNKIQQISGEETNQLIKLQIDEYHNFITSLIDYANIMEKRFFLIVNYYPSAAQAAKGLIKKAAAGSENFEESKNNLLKRVDLVISNLGSMGLRCVALGTEELLQLFYNLYNPDISSNVKVSGQQDLYQPVVKGGDNGAL